MDTSRLAQPLFSARVIYKDNICNKPVNRIMPQVKQTNSEKDGVCSTKKDLTRES
jgi:hypothetical protein